MQAATPMLVWAVIAHLIADWLLQNDWMAANKSSLRHPAAWVHGAIHTLALYFALPGPLALLVGISHMLIDTRRPLTWWKRLVGKTQSGPHTLFVEMWVDQVMHISVLAVLILIVYGR